MENTLPNIFLRAVREQDVRKLRNIAPELEDINFPDNGIEPKLVYACRPQWANITVVKTLIDLGADPDAMIRGSYTKGFTALMGADDVSIVEVLLKAGADPNLYDPTSEHNCSPPLHGAVSSNSAEIVDLFLDYGAHINALDSKNGWTALHQSLDTYPCVKSAIRLIERGADFTIAARDVGWTALHMATVFEADAVVVELLKRGAK